MPMASISDEAHRAAKQADGSIADAIDDWREAIRIFEDIHLHAVTLHTVEDKPDDDPRGARPSKPDLIRVHQMEYDDGRGAAVLRCDPSAKFHAVAGHPMGDGTKEFFDAPMAEVLPCRECFPGWDG